MSAEIQQGLLITIGCIVALFSHFQSNKTTDVYSAWKSIWKGMLPASLFFIGLVITRYQNEQTLIATLSVGLLTTLRNFYLNKDKTQIAKEI